MSVTYHIESVYNTPSHRVLRRKQEAKAKRHAVKEPLPVNAIKNCLRKHIIDIYEMADELFVPEDFLAYAMDYYISNNKLEHLDFGQSQGDISA